jgi:hypothetical protein
MPNFELSISPKYVGDWGLTQAIREIFQNALDRQTEDPDNPFLFEYDQQLQVLKIGNKNSTLCPSSLVLGNSTKGKDDRMIGQFGEGYKLALVVLLRLGKSVTIYNNPDVWTPTIKMSESFKTPVLNINTVKYRFKALPEQDLIFQISGVTPEEFEEIRRANLYFHEATEDIKTDYGRILLDPRYAGQVFVSGLLITTISRAKYGYDLKPQHINIGRDRNLVNDWDVFWNTSAMWAGAEGRGVEVDQMLADKTPDVESIHHHLYKIPKHTTEYVGGSWYCKHEGCIPCANEKQAQKARELYGKDVKTVIVSEQLFAILQMSDQYKNFSAGMVTAEKPYDLMMRVMKHIDRFKPTMQKDILALREMSRHWVWSK